MLELVRKKLPVSIDGTIYELRAPTYGDSVEYENELKKAESTEQRAEVLFSYLTKLGLPADVAKTLEIDHITEIIQYVSAEKKR